MFDELEIQRLQARKHQLKCQVAQLEGDNRLLLDIINYQKDEIAKLRAFLGTTEADINNEVIQAIRQAERIANEEVL